MNEYKSTIKALAYTYGLYLALLSIVMVLVMYAMDLPRSSTISLVSSVLTLVIYFLALKGLKDAQGGIMSPGEAIKLGLATALIGGIISAVYMYIHYSFVQPEFVDVMREEAMMNMQQNAPQATNEQIEQGMKFTEMFTTPIAMSLMSVVGSLIFGLLASLILGLFMKKSAEQ